MKSKDFEIRAPFSGVGDPSNLAPWHMHMHATQIGNVYIALCSCRGVINCCQISYTLPEILLEIFKIPEISKSEIKEC